MAAVMLEVSPSFYTNYSTNSLFISANTYEKYIVSKEYCIARHHDKRCFLPKCRYHIILMGNIKELLQKLDAFCFNYQHVDCVYTLFQHHFSGKIVVKSGQLFDHLQRAVYFNHQNRGVDRMPSIAKKRLSRKNYKKNLLSSFQKTKSTQTSGSVLADIFLEYLHPSSWNHFWTTKMVQICLDIRQSAQSRYKLASPRKQ